MVVRTPSLVYIYLSIVSRDYMNENYGFSSFSLSLNITLSSQSKSKGNIVLYERFLHLNFFLG